MTAPVTQDQRAEPSVAEQLRNHASDDHDRGCQGRCYSCECGYDTRTERLLTHGADEIELLRAQIERMQAALSALQHTAPDGWQTEVLTIASDMEAVADTVSPRDGTKHPAPYMRKQARKLRAILADERGAG